MPLRKPSRASRPAQSTVRMASSLALPDILRRFGIDPQAVLANSATTCGCSPIPMPGSPTRFAIAS